MPVSRFEGSRGLSTLSEGVLFWSPYPGSASLVSHVLTSVVCQVVSQADGNFSTGIQACREAAFQANKERLEKERTVASKIAQA